MSETPLYLFKSEFGRLVPVNGEARDLVKAIAGQSVRARITRMRANERRRAFYRVMLDVAADALTDSTGHPWDAETLHSELKKALGLGIILKTTSGREVFKPRSTSNAAMDEPTRSRWTDRCARVLSLWIGCEVEELMNEARSRNGEQQGEAA